MDLRHCSWTHKTTYCQEAEKWWALLVLQNLKHKILFCKVLGYFNCNSEIIHGLVNISPSPSQHLKKHTMSVINVFFFDLLLSIKME